MFTQHLKKMQMLPNLQNCNPLIPEKSHAAYSLRNYQLSKKSKYTHTFSTTGLYIHFTEEKGMPKCQYVRMSSFPLLKSSASPEKQGNIFPAACITLEGRRERQRPSLHWKLGLAYSLLVTPCIHQQEERKQPASLTMFVSPSFLRVKL